jgi:RNA polymerase sigma-70 factor (ECF subfamily)
MSAIPVAEAIEEIFRREAGRVLATLIRLLGDFDLAEEARQEAFAAAVEQWAAGVPDNPRAWLINTGRNKAVDRIRRDVIFRTKIFERELASAEADACAVLDEADESTFGDDRLRLILRSPCGKCAASRRKRWLALS